MDRRRGTDASTILSSVLGCKMTRRKALLTLAARWLRVTMMIGHTGRYLESRRAVLPLEVCQPLRSYALWAHLPSCEHDNGTGILFETGAHGRHRAGLRGWHRHRSQTPQFIILTDVWNSNLSKQARLVHDRHSLDRVVALRSLARQHDAVGTVKHCVTDIADLCTGRTWVVRHGLEHLRGANRWLACDVALGDHHLLGDEDLCWRNLDTKITTSDHHTVRLL